MISKPASSRDPVVCASPGLRLQDHSTAIPSLFLHAEDCTLTLRFVWSVLYLLIHILIVFNVTYIFKLLSVHPQTVTLSLSYIGLIAYDYFHTKVKMQFKYNMGQTELISFRWSNLSGPFAHFPIQINRTYLIEVAINFCVTLDHFSQVLYYCICLTILLKFGCSSMIVSSSRAPLSLDSLYLSSFLYAVFILVSSWYDDFYITDQCIILIGKEEITPFRYSKPSGNNLDLT